MVFGRPGFDRLAETNVVGNEQIDTRKPQRLSQGFGLVGFQFDASSRRRLKQIRVCCRDAVALQRLEV